VEPIGFFAYPGKPSQLKPPGAALLTLAAPHDDVPAALQALADELGVSGETTLPALARPVPPVGPLTPESIAAAVAATLPEQAVVIDEASAPAVAWPARWAVRRRTTGWQVMGGAIGWGLPGAVGAALGAPGRPVLALEGDGSAMYTVQALWTMAREQLPVVVLVFANRAYRILQGELQGVGATISGQKAADMLSLDRPALDWVSTGTRPWRAGRAVDTAEGRQGAARAWCKPPARRLRQPRALQLIELAACCRSAASPAARGRRLRSARTAR
jgi:acetolactate synthase-1/2/3 large subunit